MSYCGHIMPSDIDAALRRIVRDVVDETVRDVLRTELASVRRAPAEAAPGPGLVESRLYSVAEASEILGVGKTFLYELVNRGDIPVVQLGDERSKLRLRGDHIRTWIEKRTIGRSN